MLATRWNCTKRDFGSHVIKGVKRVVNTWFGCLPFAAFIVGGCTFDLPVVLLNAMSLLTKGIRQGPAAWNGTNTHTQKQGGRRRQDLGNYTACQPLPCPPILERARWATLAAA
mmetsp:Transcript_8019/g.14707  ORF Transcript_8019/g.14707 Transcript_8019/m.14707 type:complete len:113 (+) Transcript_8019:502-840(+)